MLVQSQIQVSFVWENGKVQSIRMRLTWNKRYITLAPIATVLGLAFKLSDLINS